MSSEEIDELLLKATGKEKVVKIEPFRFREKVEVAKSYNFHFTFDKKHSDKFERSTYEILEPRFNQLNKDGNISSGYSESSLRLLYTEEIAIKLRENFLNIYKQKLKLPINKIESIESLEILPSCGNQCFDFTFESILYSEERIGLSLTLENNLIQIAYISEDKRNVQILSGIKTNRIEYLGNYK
jgi:hypothetical protein